MTSLVRGNENRTIGAGNSAGPVPEMVAMWYGYNSNYGTRRAPTDGVVVNYTERRLDWIIDWVMNRSGVFKIDPTIGVAE